MRHLAVFLVLFGLVLSACASRAPGTVVTVEPPQARAASFTMHGDVDFTDVERAAIISATNEWRSFSGGRVDIKVVFDLDFDDESAMQYKQAPVIIRVDSTMRLGVDPGTIAFTNSHHQIALIMDRLTSFRPVVMHEMGHAAGLRWPDWCPSTRYGDADCDHSPDLNSIMSAVYRGAQSFTPADKAFCRAAGYCP